MSKAIRVPKGHVIDQARLLNVSEASAARMLSDFRIRPATIEEVDNPKVIPLILVKRAFGCVHAYVRNT